MSLFGWETLLNKVLLVMRLFFSHKVFIFFCPGHQLFTKSQIFKLAKTKSICRQQYVFLGWKENIVEKGMRLFFSHNVFKWSFLHGH